MDKITRFQNLQISEKAGEAVTGFSLFKRKMEKGMVCHVVSVKKEKNGERYGDSCSICKRILLFGCLSLRRENS